MLLCPSCGRIAGEKAICPCGTDLTLLKAIVAQGDALFNRAVVAYSAGRIPQALELLSSNELLVPFDVEARIMQAKLLLLQSRHDEAARLIKRVQKANPNHIEVASLLTVLAEQQEQQGE